MFPYSTILKENPIFTFSFNLIQHLLYSMCEIFIKVQNRNVLLLRYLVEEAKLNNCSTHTLQILYEGRVL